jgi:hypothetical protein
MRTRREITRLREQAIKLRRAGKSRREIGEALRIGGSTLDNALKGEPAPEWTDPYGSRELAAEAHQAYYAAKRAARDAERDTVRTAAAAEIGTLSERELRIAGAIAYWCEGTKTKPYRKYVPVIFINSDPGLVLLFLRFLGEAGVSRDRIRFRVHIHESADAEAATRWWADLVGATQDQLQRPTIKRHQPKVSYRDDTGDYHGCLRITVLRSGDLYRQIAGWASGVTRTA